MAQPIRVAVLGFGMSATVFHIPFILALPNLFTLKGIMERKATAEKSLARDAFPSVKIYTTLDQVLNDEEIDLVFVTTINDTHYDYCKQALLANKHVVIEKPITPTSEEAFELAKLAKSKNLILAVYQNRRFDSDFLTVKKLLSEGTFGELSRFESHYDRYKNEPAIKLWKELALPGSGCQYDLGSHLIDQVLSLFGTPTSVTAIISNSRLIGSLDVADSFTIHLNYPATSVPGRKLPLIATVNASILSLASPQLRFNIQGTEATFIKFGLDVQEDQLKKSGSLAVSEAGFGIEPTSLEGTLYKQGSSEKIKTSPGLYKNWFESVGNAIQKGDPSLLAVKAEESALGIKVIEAAVQSAKEGRTVTIV